MKRNEKYDPEDIESLMLHKQFNELYPEEKEFVLRHLDDEQAYENMRKLLLEIREIAASDDMLTPDPSIREYLLSELSREKKGRFSVWLNSLFTAPDIPWFRQTGTRLAFGMVILLVGVAGMLQWSVQKNEITGRRTFSENRTEKEEEIQKTEKATENNVSATETISKVEVDNSFTAIPEEPPVIREIQQAGAERPVVESKMAEAESAAYDNLAAVPATDDTDHPENVSPAAGNAPTSTDKATSVAEKATVLREVTAIESISRKDTPVSASLGDYSDLIGVLFTAR